MFGLKIISIQRELRLVQFELFAALIKTGVSL